MNINKSEEFLDVRLSSSKTSKSNSLIQKTSQNNLITNEDNSDFFNISKSASSATKSVHDVSESNNNKEKDISNIQISFSCISDLDVKDSVEPSKIIGEKKEVSMSTNSVLCPDNNKEKLADASCTPSVCNYYQRSNNVTPIGKNEEIKLANIKQVNLNLIYNNMNFPNGTNSCDDLVMMKSISGTTTKRTPIKYTKAQCGHNNEPLDEKKNLISHFNSKKGGKSLVLEVEKNENIEIINDNANTNKCNEQEVEDSNINFQITPCFRSTISDSKKISFFSKTISCSKEPSFSNGFRLLSDSSSNGGKEQPFHFIAPCSTSKINPFKKTTKRNPVNIYSHARSFSSRSNKSEQSSSKEKTKPATNKNPLLSYGKSIEKKTPSVTTGKKKTNSFSDINIIIANHIRNSLSSTYNNNKTSAKKQKIIGQSKEANVTPSSIIKQIKNNSSKGGKGSTTSKKMSYVQQQYRTNEYRTNDLKREISRSKSKSKSKSQSKSKSRSQSRSKNVNGKHEKKKTQINLQSVLSKVESFGARSQKRENNSVYSFKSVLNKTSITNDSNFTVTNKAPGSNVNKINHTQETQNTTTGNNICTAANTTISSVKKSPKVIQDFSFYKKKNNYNCHFISKDSMNQHGVPLNKKYPIVSIKLSRLSGDNDSIGE